MRKWEEQLHWTGGVEKRSPKFGIVRLVLLGCILLIPKTSAAADLSIAGLLRLSDGASPAGTRVTLSVDLDQDGKFSSSEVLSAEVKKDGSYSVDYSVDTSDLSQLGGLLQAATSGVEALVSGNPVRAAITFERPGYSTITRNINLLAPSLKLNAQLTPLLEILCDGERCQTPGGSVILDSLAASSGAARVFAEAYDPKLHTSRFPGIFADENDSLLTSSGFAEIDVRDEDGNAITKLDEPAAVRYELKRDSWKTLTDLRPDIDGIQLPMYSFDEASAEWVAEQDGLLVDEAGQPVAESSLDDVRSGEYSQKLYVSFTTVHFSYFNVDYPTDQHACVKGRIVDGNGHPVAGALVTVAGVSYVGNAGSVTTRDDGYFAGGALRSTASSTERAAIRVSVGDGLYESQAFDVTEEQNKVLDKGGLNCAPADCDCPSLGDLELIVEEPSICRVQVDVTASAHASNTRDLADYEDALEVSVVVDGEASGFSDDRCHGGVCGVGRVVDGEATIDVMALGDAELDVTVRGSSSGLTYYGRARVTGCSAKSTVLAEQVEVEVDAYVTRLVGYAFPSDSTGNAFSQNTTAAEGSTGSPLSQGASSTQGSNTPTSSSSQSSSSASSTSRLTRVSDTEEDDKGRGCSLGGKGEASSFGVGCLLLLGALAFRAGGRSRS